MNVMEAALIATEVNNGHGYTYTQTELREALAAYERAADVYDINDEFLTKVLRDELDRRGGDW